LGRPGDGNITPSNHQSTTGALWPLHGHFILLLKLAHWAYVCEMLGPAALCAGAGFCTTG
jgi:hypothetical protein